MSANLLPDIKRHRSPSAVTCENPVRSEHGAGDDDDYFNEPSSLAHAPSIGAISAITGVSCFDDEENEDVEDGDVDKEKEMAQAIFEVNQ